MSVKVVAAINSMNKQGHYARVYRHQDKMWVEIDQCMLASFDEIEELVDGVHSFEELADVFKRRHAEELAAFSLWTIASIFSSRAFALGPFAWMKTILANRRTILKLIKQGRKTTSPHSIRAATLTNLIRQ